MSPLERTLHRDHYLSEDSFALERERIFAREWFCVGREEELPATGDWITRDVAGESVLLVRTREGRLAGHFNVCRHRGARLVPECSRGGFASGIRCPYHSWTYTLEGSLRTAPFLELADETPGLDIGPDAPYSRPPMPAVPAAASAAASGARPSGSEPGAETPALRDLSLHPVGVDTWGGFVFVNLEPAEARARGHTLAAQLGGAADRVRRYPLAELRAAHSITYGIQANWKVMLENYNECYHCGPVHPELCRLVPAFKQRGGADLDWERGIPHREGAWTFTSTGTSARAPFPGLDQDERTRHKGELVYPNLMVSLSAEHVAAFYLEPHGAGSTTIRCEFLFHPDEMARPGFDPSDAVELWDLVNRQDWAICESVQRGMSSRVFQTGYYAPMESWSLDIRRYVGEKLGEGRKGKGQGGEP